MRMTPPAGRLGRVIAVSVTLFVVLVAWLAIVMPLYNWYWDGQARLDQREALAARMTALSTQLPMLSQRAAALGLSGVASGLLTGDTDALSAAQLQEVVQNLAIAEGVTPTSIEILPTEQKTRYRRIALRLSLVSPFPELVHLLQAIGRATPHMLVEDLVLEGAALINQPVDTPLHAELTLVAFRHAE